MDLLRVPDPSSVSGDGQECPEPQRVTYPAQIPIRAGTLGPVWELAPPWGTSVCPCHPMAVFTHLRCLPLSFAALALPFTPAPITGSRAATLAQTAHLPTTCNVVASVATYCAAPSR